MTWLEADGTEISSGQGGYTVDTGTYVAGFQTTTLTVDAAQNNQDATFKCLVKSDEDATLKQSLTIYLKVFSKCAQYVLRYEISEVKD